VVFRIELSYAEKTPSCAWMQWLSRWFMRVVQGWPVSSGLSTHFLLRIFFFVFRTTFSKQPFSKQP
jgi:hypothetical protein